MAIEFANKNHQATYNKVACYLDESFGGYRYLEDSPIFMIDAGSSEVRVVVKSTGERSTMLHVVSYFIYGPRLDDELRKFLLTESARLELGFFATDDDGDVMVSYSMSGSTCDKEDLTLAVEVIGEICNRYDDLIQQRWGGKRIADLRADGGGQ